MYLCTYLHVTQGHLSKIERGEIAPSLEMLILLSDRFHKSADWILRGEGHSRDSHDPLRCAHLDRQLYRAMDQLERLLRQRRGEAVPPPLNINLGRGR